ncbi:hypothetical protein [Actinacidiphila rubida]|uniref:Integral membrane protein n=1 Tax=Actinacidiphila rubida TaxID=310780 RepID=A0A1H8JSJ5_9ACTN|nr:hypothetical protein [Actinacidiphila rubida]SEN83531.1 hypothetical protein SAMN05216267_101123 [Actinacidiphila rubida]
MAAAETPQDDDALFVLTAALLTPGQYPGVLGDDYPSACAGLGLVPAEAGYGLVFGQDGTGARWTVATTDTWMVACALAAWDCGLEYELSPDDHSIAASLPGWPLPVAVAAPGVPAPFDPDEETGGGPPLAPPDPTQWGPAQRRLGADEIAIHWREWRDELDAPAEDAEATGTAPAGAGTQATTSEAAATDDQAGAAGDADDTEPEEPGAGPAGAETAAEASGEGPEPGTADAPAGDAPISHSGVRGVLEAAEEYVRTPPPPGRVRLAYGSLRADGPGWSLVGRADDMAFVLLDEAPGEILPVGRGPSLPILMEALGRLASAPSTTAAAAS